MTDSDSTTCAVVGGGPAGMVLGLLLARAGVEVTVFEKHPDFFRDFRGDTVHPVTLTLLEDLGLFEQFEALPHSEIEKAEFEIAGRKVDQAMIDEIDRLSREKAEREALEWAAAEVDDDLSKGGDDL